jgi:hypothetical protein
MISATKVTQHKSKNNLHQNKYHPEAIGQHNTHSSKQAQRSNHDRKTFLFFSTYYFKNHEVASKMKFS